MEKKDKSGIYILVFSLIAMALIIGVSIILYQKEVRDLDGHKDADIASIGNDYGSVVETDVELFRELRDSNMVSLIYVGRPTCSFCIQIYPNLQEVAEEHFIDFFYVNTDEWDPSDTRGVLSRAMNNFQGTPTLFIMYNGREVSSITGYRSVEFIVEWLTDNDFIREA
jgi:thiol-disulfide isomerase/thioredoxin